MQATSTEELFGEIAKHSPDSLKSCFRQLAQQVHPDHNPDFKSAANEAFLKLQFWYERACIELQTAKGGLKFESKEHVYVTTAVSTKGDLTDLHSAKISNQKVILKVIRHPKNNDLMLAESQALKKIQRRLTSDPLIAHFPSFIESFRVKDSAGAERIINVLNDEHEFVPLIDIMNAYPQGIHPADAAWMFNRLLAALAKTHELGLVHGAVIPPHLLLNLNDHNGKLIDWCYTVEIGKNIKAISPTFKQFYPPEVLEKHSATPATDIYMAAMVLLKLLGGDESQRKISPQTPKPITALLNACLLQAPHRRPQHSWALFDDFQDILQRLYGAPRFRPFSL